jgi:hypothetical protein
MALLMLFSSGCIQLALHSCPGSGTFLFSDCGMHETEENQHVSECCKKKLPSKKKQEGCGNCEEYFVFSISPKFGSFITAEAGDPPVFRLSDNPLMFADKLNENKGTSQEFQKELPPKLLHYQALYAVWLI